MSLVCGHKGCRFDKRPQPEENFDRSAYTKSGYRAQCRECTRDMAKERRARQRAAWVAQGGKVRGKVPAPVAAVQAAPEPESAGEDFDIDFDEPPDPKPALKRGSPPRPQPIQDDKLRRLVDLTRKSPLSFEAACDAVDVSPAKLRALVAEAGERCLAVRIDGQMVGFPKAEPAFEPVQIAPVTSGVVKVGVVSDTHLGSKYCLRAQLREFIEYAYSQGVRTILHPGDVLDGAYKHGTFEVSHTGLDDQVNDLFQVLPKLPGLTYRLIGGNHDGTWMDLTGVSTGAFMVRYFQERGRNDLYSYGDRGAFLKIGEVIIHLWHPSGGVGYALSHPMNQKIQSYSPGQKPHILLVGHWHRFCYLYERGIHAIACGTFQGSGSAFSKSLRGAAPAIGGTILSWSTTEHSTIRDFSVLRRNFFESEMVHDVAEGLINAGEKALR